MNNLEALPRGIWVILATDSRRCSVIICEICGKEITTTNCLCIPRGRASRNSLIKTKNNEKSNNTMLMV